LIPFFYIFFLVVTTGLGDIHFTDVTAKWGVPGYNWFGGHGICWVDVNGDGRMDIYVKNVAGKIYDVPNNLFINYKNHFLEEAIDRGISDAYGVGTHGAVFSDFDKDGDFDLFSTTTFDRTTAHNHLYKNDGHGNYEDITNTIQPKQDINTSARGVAAADFDNDGDIDFFFSNALANTDPFNPNPIPRKHVKNFYIRKKDGTYSLRSKGIDWTGFVQGVTAVDIDGDGDIDIAEAKWTMPSTIYLNDGKGSFTDSGADMGLPQALGVRDNGITFGDLDNDGDLDIAIIGESIVKLYKNASNSFNLSQSIYVQGHFHVSFGDFDHDCDLDLFISGGNVFENDGRGNYSLIPTEDSGLNSSLRTKDARSSGLGDFDNDGDLDIYITDKQYFNVLMRNDLDNSDWIQVDIIDQNKTVGKIGTKLDLYLAGHLGGSQYLKGHREAQGEYGYLGQDMPTIHFGAPASKQYDLRVTFTDGTKKKYYNITPGQKIQVEYQEPEDHVYSPLNFRNTRKKFKIWLHKESIIILSWAANPQNQNIQQYRIYTIQGNYQTLLAEVSADVFEYRVKHTGGKTQLEFSITAVNTDGREGDAAYLCIPILDDKTRQ